MKKEEKEYLSNLLKKSSYNVLTMKEILNLLEFELNEKELEAYLDKNFLRLDPKCKRWYVRIVK